MLCPQCQSSGRATARIDGTKVILNFELMNMNPEEFAEYVEEHRMGSPLNPPQRVEVMSLQFSFSPPSGGVEGGFSLHHPVINPALLFHSFFTERKSGAMGAFLHKYTK